MTIFWDESTKIFHLQAGDSSYVMQVVHEGFLAHLYWGRKIEDYRFANPLQFVDRAFSGNPYPSSDRTFSLDTLPQEFPVYGTTDYRAPIVHVQLENGTTITDFRYCSHQIYIGEAQIAVPLFLISSLGIMDNTAIMSWDSAVTGRKPSITLKKLRT